MPTYPSSQLWTAIVTRIAEDAGVRPGELVLIRDRTGDRAILDAVMLAVEAKGGTLLPEITSPAYLTNLLRRTDPAPLSSWDVQCVAWVRSADRIVKLAGGSLDLSQAPAAAAEAWEEAIGRLAAIEDEPRIPSVLVAVPVPEKAEELHISIQALESISTLKRDASPPSRHEKARPTLRPYSTMKVVRAGASATWG